MRHRRLVGQLQRSVPPGELSGHAKCCRPWEAASRQVWRGDDGGRCGRRLDAGRHEHIRRRRDAARDRSARARAARRRTRRRRREQPGQLVEAHCVAGRVLFWTVFVRWVCIWCCAGRRRVCDGGGRGASEGVAAEGASWISFNRGVDSRGTAKGWGVRRAGGEEKWGWGGVLRRSDRKGVRRGGAQAKWGDGVPSRQRLEKKGEGGVESVGAMKGWG